MSTHRRAPVRPVASLPALLRAIIVRAARSPCAARHGSNPDTRSTAARMHPGRWRPPARRAVPRPVRFAKGERPPAPRKPVRRRTATGRCGRRGYAGWLALARARKLGRPPPALNGRPPKRPTDDANTNATRRDAATPAYPPRRPRGPHPGTLFSLREQIPNTHTTVVST
jgi:hypothetical protein